MTIEMELTNLTQAPKDRGRQARNYEKHRLLLEWHSPTTHAAQYAEIMARRVNGTGQWFLDSPEFVKWLSEPKTTLFCYGKPGAGKTFLATAAIDYLLKMTRSKSCGVAYVYCRAQASQKISAMLSAILQQLVLQELPTLEPVETLFSKNAHRWAAPSPSSICRALREVLEYYSTVYVVVDGLDECQDYHEFIRNRLLSTIVELQVKSDIRILFTSRHKPVIHEGLRFATWRKVQAEEQDLERLVDSEIYRLPGCILCDSKLLHWTKRKICANSDRNFLITRLQLDLCAEERDPAAVRTALDRLSIEQSEPFKVIYGDTLRKIQSQQANKREAAKKMLSLIMYANRPLTVPEIRCALTIHASEAELDLLRKTSAIELVSLCAGLAVHDKLFDIVSLVHDTARECLECMRDVWFTHTDARLYVARTCLSYLESIFSTRSICSTDEEFEQLQQKNAFLDYAARNWGDHVRMVEKEVFEEAFLFLNDKELLICVAQAMSAPEIKEKGYSQRYPTYTALHYTAEFGLSCLTKKILVYYKQSNCDQVAINLVTNGGVTPLILAAENARHVTVKLLIDMGADINIKGGFYGNALQAASAGGLDQTVRLLLDAGADINAQGGFYSTPLQAAVHSGDSPTVRLLLARGANVNTIVNDLSALSIATCRRDVTIMEILLAHGASLKDALSCLESFDAQDSRLLLGKFLKQIALSYAVKGGHKAMVESLLDMGVDVNHSSDRVLVTPLHLAAVVGSVTIARMLLNADADPTREDHLGRNAYFYADGAGPLSIVEEIRRELDRFTKVMPLALFHTVSGGRTQVKWVHIPRGLQDRMLFSQIYDTYKATRNRKWWQYSLKGFQGVCFVEGTTISSGSCTVITTTNCVPESRLLRDGTVELDHKIRKPPSLDSDERIWAESFWKEIFKRPQDQSTSFGIRFAEGWVIRRIRIVAFAYLLFSSLIGVLWSTVLRQTEAGFAITACLIAAESLVVALMVFEGQIHPAIS